MPRLHELVTGSAGRGVTAVLGPTNTGKTHLALERMLRHRSGMIGLPLRLLAREVYDKVVARVGEHAVALVTGEEKIVPTSARYYVCTVEAMPLDRVVAFLAVDEIQLAAHRTRGHVFTDRLLHARGVHETLFLGSASIARVVRALVPTAEVMSQPRLSRLSFAGHHKLQRLPPRSAVVAFSAEQVYEIAEQLRRKHGGTAVVLGALSPRTRNAQVALYQGGEVPFLVATDAIGMGLNMDVDHVAFASLRKFDGRSSRHLYDEEIAQIAGRAGRYLRDGTFGTTANAHAFEVDTVEAVEQHRFAPITRIWWRNIELDFSSPDALVASLEAPPPLRLLRRMPDAGDHETLVALLRDPEIRSRAESSEQLRLLWEVAQIPDYRKTLTHHHADLLGQIFTHLDRTEQLPMDWIDARLRRLDRTEGDLDALMTRIAHVRTWTYVSQRSSWVPEAVVLQERTRAIEDRLSDALHEKLTARFVDHRVLVLPPGAGLPDVALADDGSLRVGEREVGRLDGLDVQGVGQGTALARAVAPVVAGPLAARAAALAAAPDPTFHVDSDGVIVWLGVPVGRWRHGASTVEPRLGVRGADWLDPESRGAVHRRLLALGASLVGRVIGDLPAADDPAVPTAAARVLADLRAHLGTARAEPLAEVLADLPADDSRLLARLGVRLGVHAVYVARGLDHEARRIRAALWAAWSRAAVELPPPDALTMPNDPAALALGFVAMGPVAVRADVLERAAARLREAARRGPFAPPRELPSWLGVGVAQAIQVAEALGYDVVRIGPDLRLVYRARSRRPPRRRRDR